VEFDPGHGVFRLIKLFCGAACNYDAEFSVGRPNLCHACHSPARFPGSCVRGRPSVKKQHIGLRIGCVSTPDVRVPVCNSAGYCELSMIKQRIRPFARNREVAPVLLPPNLHTIGSVPFSDQDFNSLDAWLAEEGWPQTHMDIAMLEGYLVALITWPIELSPGAWLPAIWGIRGWKVAAKIASSDSFSKFIALIIGYVQELDRRLTESLPTRTFVLARDEPLKSCQHFAGAQWSAGFLTALQETSSGFSSRSATVRAAVETIARFASLRTSAPSTLPQVATILHSSVMTIVSERPSAGLFTTGKSVPAKIPGLKPQQRSHTRKPTAVSLPPVSTVYEVNRLPTSI
jgi:yecA family protein